MKQYLLHAHHVVCPGCLVSMQHTALSSQHAYLTCSLRLPQLPTLAEISSSWAHEAIWVDLATLLN